MQDLSAVPIQKNGDVGCGDGVYDGDAGQDGGDALLFLSTHAGVGYADVGVDAGADVGGANVGAEAANALSDSSAKDAKGGKDVGNEMSVDGEDVRGKVGFHGEVLEGPSWVALEIFLCLHALHVRVPSRAPTYLHLAACLQDPNLFHQKASDSTQNSGIWSQHWTQTLYLSRDHGCSSLQLALAHILASLVLAGGVRGREAPILALAVVWSPVRDQGWIPTRAGSSQTSPGHLETSPAHQGPMDIHSPAQHQTEKPLQVVVRILTSLWGRFLDQLSLDGTVEAAWTVQRQAEAVHRCVAL